MLLCPVVNNLVRNNKFDSLMYTSIMGFFIGMIITYLIVIKPLLIDNKLFGKGVANMMKDYYSHDNAIKVAGIDIIFILLYLAIAFVIYQQIGKHMPTKYPCIDLFIVLLLTVIVVDLIIGLLINIIPYKSNTLDFFRKWGKTAGFKSIIYDCILLTIVYFTTLLLIKYKLNTKWHFIGLMIIILTYFFST